MIHSRLKIMEIGIFIYQLKKITLNKTTALLQDVWSKYL